MNPEIVITLIVLLIASACFAIIKLIGKRNKNIVIQSSTRLKALDELNGNTKFNDISSSYLYRQSCRSKQQLNHFSIKDFFINTIIENEFFFKRIIDSVSYNRDEYKKYLTSAKSIQSTVTESFCKSKKISLYCFLKHEQNLLMQKLLAQPTIDVTITCEAHYVSPKGRNRYSKEYLYDFEQLLVYYDLAVYAKKNKETYKYNVQSERAKMTDSLRYDILKRDNFKCQICGATAKDGAKLHVDHITPVSKGGKTVKSNLQTLCERCNLGKSNK